MFPSFSNSEISSFNKLETQETVLQSVLWRSEFLIYMKRSFMNKLNRIGPRIQIRACARAWACGTPDKSN